MQIEIFWFKFLIQIELFFIHDFGHGESNMRFLLLNVAYMNTSIIPANKSGVLFIRKTYGV